MKDKAKVRDTKKIKSTLSGSKHKKLQGPATALSVR